MVVNKMLTYIVLLVLTVEITTAMMPAKVIPCKEGTEKETKVFVDKVQKGMIVLTKGTSANLTIEFQSGVNSPHSKSVCHGVIGGIPVPFPVADSKGCDSMTPSCPLNKGKPYTFKTSIPVQKIYPSMKLLIKWQEVDPDTKQDILCIILPAIIES